MNTSKLRERMQARRDKGWSFDRIADYYGLPRTTVFNFLKGAGMHSRNLDKLTAKKVKP